MHSKKFSTDIPLLKKMSHEKRNSATTIKVMSSKENFDCLDQHKHYESLLRVSLNKKLETMSGGKNKV